MKHRHLARSATVPVRTSLVIDDGLMREAMQAAGATSKREAVETALRLLVRLERQARIRQGRGRLHWVGDLDAERRDS
jgi:Arc/MetJ family transcription regulator